MEFRVPTRTNIRGPLFGPRSDRNGTEGVTPTVPGPTATGAEATIASSPPKRRREWPYVSAGVAVVVIVVAFFVAFAPGLHHELGSPPQVLVLAPSGTSYSLPQGQISGIVFQANSPSTLRGTVNSSEGFQLYIMNHTDYQILGKLDVVSGYAWTSGAIGAGSLYTLGAAVPAGPWILVFTDPNPAFPTGISVYTDVDLVTPT